MVDYGEIWHARGSRVYHKDSECPYLKRLFANGTEYAGMGDAEELCTTYAELLADAERWAAIQREWDNS